ncbi:MAG: outer membrane beta-barrel protein [Acidobacteriota bacterium]
MLMTKKKNQILLCVVLAAGTAMAGAQVKPAATARQISLTAGAVGSFFQPDYAGGGVPQASPDHLDGMGVYIDVGFTHWVQLEAEGRWLDFNEYRNISQNNYLIGPRIPIYPLRFWKVTPYGKVLVGWASMNFEDNFAWGRFTDIAYGGGMDIQVSKRLSIRAIDFEYQQWPDWLNTSLHPYGYSAGIGYTIFGAH